MFMNCELTWEEFQNFLAIDLSKTFKSRESWRRWYNWHHPADPAGWSQEQLASASCGHFDENDMWVPD